MTKNKKLSEDTFSSPACSMNEFNGPYMGFLSNSELSELLTKWLQQEIQAAIFFAASSTDQQKELSQKRKLVFEEAYQLLMTMEPSLSTTKSPTSFSTALANNNFEDFKTNQLLQIRSSLSKISQEPIRKLLESLLP